MGVDCSCLRSDNKDTKSMTEIDMSKNKVPYSKQSEFKDEDNDAVIDLETNIKLDHMTVVTSLVIQSAIRGYLTRRDLKLEKEAQIHSHPKPEDLYEKLDYTITKLQASAVIDIENKLGYFDMSKPINDGVKVDKKQALKLDDGTIYEGEWNLENQKHGRGVEINDDGSKYIGYFADDKKEGKGRLIHKNGDLFQGYFSKGKATGFGVYAHEDGSKYEGDFKNDRQHGKGREEYPDGSVYVGDYRNGLKDGKGKFKWADGSQFEGEFKANNIEGHGTYIWADQKSYTGEWVNNKMHGTGVFK